MINDGDTLCACGCGGSVASPDARGRPRLYCRGHNVRVNQQPGFTFAGRTHTDDALNKMSEHASKPRPHLRGSANGMFGRTGASNPNYKSGSSPERQRLYASSVGRELRRAVLQRDQYRCVECGERPGGSRALHIHHVKPWATFPELRFEADNVVTLCRSCHHNAHRKGVSSQNGVDD